MTDTDRKNQALAQQIADALGGELEPHEYEWHAERYRMRLPQIHPDARLVLTFDGWKSEGRLRVRHDYPAGEDRHSHSPSYYLSRNQVEELGLNADISVSYARPVDKLAADIRRRSLFNLDKALELMTEAKRVRDECEARKDALFAELCHIVGVDPATDRNRDREFNQYNGGHNSIKAGVRYDELVGIELSCLDPDLAKAVLRLVKRWAESYRSTTPQTE